MDQQQMQSKSPLSVPMAIVIAAIIIAVSIVWIKKPTGTISATASSTVPIPSAQTTLAPVTSSDHILGNPNAPIKIVEFSDPSCPYCKLFFPVMQQIMNTYGASGQVAWVYRAFPLDKPYDAAGDILHPNAGHESQALECANVLGGNTKFWAYADRLYSITPSVTPQTPNGLDQSQLPVIAQYVGLNVTAFNTCLSSGQTANTVNNEYEEGIAAGVDGTPYSFIVTSGSNTPIPVPGADTYAQMQTIINQLIAAEATSTTDDAAAATQ
jgi:protein-disulfide isomerase